MPENDVGQALLGCALLKPSKGHTGFGVLGHPDRVGSVETHAGFLKLLQQLGVKGATGYLGPFSYAGRDTQPHARRAGRGADPCDALLPEDLLQIREYLGSTLTCLDRVFGAGGEFDGFG
ncbi:hypothetical protein OG285_35640 [Streptomyces sp. NBC_01471]|uniref:hypothetical protein n=1 Tax=Streptomyces sp. NBC_01471 TaxID=2903879 RepID=UPI003252819A